MDWFLAGGGVGGFFLVRLLLELILLGLEVESIFPLACRVWEVYLSRVFLE